MAKRRKKMIEVALPLEAINKESAREKSIRHGHPSTLHLWWARRPLAACRAVLFAQLVDDPDSDPTYCNLDGTVDEEQAGLKRAQLFNLIEELVIWENSNNPSVLNRARSEIARCFASRKIELGEFEKATIIYGKDEGQLHPQGPISEAGTTAYDVVLQKASPDVVNHFLATYAPPILDPFAGGGSIPLEAQRLGLRAHASDLNPVPVLINKALIEIPPKFSGMAPVNQTNQQRSNWQGAQGIAEDVRHYGQWMRDQAEKRIGHLYPKVKITQEMIDAGRQDLKLYLNQELTVIAWLWARTVKCQNPACGRRMPMLRSFWLSRKKGREVWAEPILDYENGSVHFAIQRDGEPPMETSNRTMARCLFCNDTMKKGKLRKTARDHGLQEVPLAIVAEGKGGRIYLEANESDIPNLEKPSVLDIDQLMTDDKRWFSPPQYGLPSFIDLFTPRQLTALVVFSDLVAEARQQVLADAASHDGLPNDDRSFDEGGVGPNAYADAVATYLAFAVDKSADYWSNLCSWHNSGEKMRNTFGRQALPMVWDFAECNIMSESTGNWLANIDWVWKVIERLPAECFAHSQQANVTEKATYDLAPVLQCDATEKATYAMTPVISCDPPYYDNIGYADLSDFLYVWLRRSLRDQYPKLLGTMLTPKAEELIATPYRHEGSKQKAAAFFEKGLGHAILRWRELGFADIPTTIFYAFKQAETDTHGTASTGWETFLSGVIEAGFVITATWPMRTELSNRMVGMGTNALASSIVLSCVPRETDAPLATRREFLTTLRRELPKTLRDLQIGSIAPVDLAQAAIGPGMGIYSRYTKVVEANGEPMPVRQALILINQILDEVLAEQDSDFDSDTRWALKWFEQYGHEEGLFGDAETLAKAMAVSVQGVVESGIAKSGTGKVRLLKREELDEAWDPQTDERLTMWEATQYMIRSLEESGEPGAAALLKRLGTGVGETARELAYRLYQICERKKWANHALSYNGLIVSWREIEKLSHDIREAPKPYQTEMNFEE
ncbi:DUF1156 domain-containing protein [Planctomycetota bacterium]